MGRQQEDWLFAGFKASKAQWKVLAQQVMMMDLDRDPAADKVRYNIDSWGGYRTRATACSRAFRTARSPTWSSSPATSTSTTLASSTSTASSRDQADRGRIRLHLHHLRGRRAGPER